MKLKVLFVLSVFCISPAQAQPLQMPARTPIQLRLDAQVNSYYNKEGDMVPLSVNKDVYASSGSFLLIRRSSRSSDFSQ